MKAPGSLQGRLLLLLLSAVVGVWIATAAATWLDARHEIDELLDSHLAQAAALLVAQQAREFEHEDDDEDDEYEIEAPSLHRYSPKVAFQVFHEGRPALRSANAPEAPMLGDSRRFKTGFATVRIGDAQWRVFAAYGAERDIQVYVGEQMRSRGAILWAVLRSTLWPMMLALPLLALSVWWAVSSNLAPLRMLGRTLAQRRPQELSPVELERAPSEMAPMIDALNILFARISTLLDAERRFTADAAHELRTPIAAIRAQAQVALGEQNDALRRRALEKTLEGCDRAAHLVDQLLTLSRLEALEAHAMQPVDLAELTRRVIAELAPKAIGKGQTIEFEADQFSGVAGDETLLAVLVRNLLDNAVRYSPVRARVRVRVQRLPGSVQLNVEDSGPGLGEEDRRRLGQRFFRAPGAEESGSGLGWSIIRRIAAVHGFQTEVGRSAELGGLAVRVEAPAGAGKRPSA